MTVEFDAGATDPEKLAEMFTQLEAGETAEQPKADETKVDDPKPEATAKSEAGTEGTQQSEQSQAEAQGDPAGVATKDGKHVIPFSVLRGERERATRAEQAVADLQAQIDTLTAQVKAGSEGAKQGEGARTEAETVESSLSEEDLAALKEDFPTVYKGLVAMQAQAKSLRDQLDAVNASVKTTEAREQQNTAETVQDAIDSIPKLAHIQANNQEAFDMARQIDATLRGQAAWKDKSLAERFQKVTEMVEAALGPIELPDAGKPSQGADNVVDLKAAAKAKAAEAASKGGKAGVPTSLSEFPGGQAAATDEAEAITNMTPFQLAEKFAGMTDAQMDAYLQKLN